MKETEKELPQKSNDSNLDVYSEPDTCQHEVLVAVDIEKETSLVTSMEPTVQIPVEVHEDVIEQEVMGIVSDKEDSVVSKIEVPETDLTPNLTQNDNVISEPVPEVITKKSIQWTRFNKDLQTHREKFDILISKLEEFSFYPISSHDNAVFLYQPFVQELKEDFAEIGENFFSEAHIRDKQELNRTFVIFKSECERLSQKAENYFKHETGIWSHIKPILTGFVGVIIAIAATLLTLGVATYYVAKNENLRSQYMNTFFKSEPSVIQDVKNKWPEYSVKQNFFGDKALEKNGLVNEIEKTVVIRLYT